MTLAGKATKFDLTANTRVWWGLPKRTIHTLLSTIYKRANNVMAA